MQPHLNFFIPFQKKKLETFTCRNREPISIPKLQLLFPESTHPIPRATQPSTSQPPAPCLSRCLESSPDTAPSSASTVVLPRSPLGFPTQWVSLFPTHRMRCDTSANSRIQDRCCVEHEWRPHGAECRCLNKGHNHQHHFVRVSLAFFPLKLRAGSTPSAPPLFG